MHQARVQGGGPKGPGPPPPLEIEKQKKKKKKKKVIRANIKLFHLYFATFLVENISFSAIFGAGPPPPEKLKSKKKKKKKKSFHILGPPSYEFLDTRLVHCNTYVRTAVIVYIILLGFYGQTDIIWQKRSRVRFSPTYKGVFKGGVQGVQTPPEIFRFFFEK